MLRHSPFRRYVPCMETLSSFASRGSSLVLRTAQGEHMRQKKILLVDDSATTLMMEQMVLRGQPYQIVTAKNGREAIAVALLEHPDLVLLDVVMPEMNGFETCRELRQLPVTKNVPIIMVTTKGEEQNVETGFESGCSDYITKPINGTELLMKVRGFLDVQEAGGAA
jgi:two-component system alkaline phosphatase synthesis response regulator PhoP